VGRRSWRWAVVVLGVALLALLPTLASAVPARTTTLSAQELLRRVRASGPVGWSGYGESRGALVLPDVRELSDLPSLVGGTTRVRAWWRGTRDWRVDALSLVGETDTTRDPDGGWTWQSADRRAVRVVGELDVRLPTAADLLAPALGRRLAGTPDVDASRLPGRRVAGRSADGLRLVPRDPGSTTVRSVELWADPGTGLPLRVEVSARGSDEPQLTALLLDLDLSRPPAERTAFERPQRASVTVGEAPDLAALADRFAPYLLPDRLAGLPRRARSLLSTGGGVGTYGDGFTVLALVPVPRDLARRVIDRVDPEDDDGTGAVTTPLVNALVGQGRRGRAYVLVGTVPQARLVTALAQLRAAPPPRLRR
jgi:hypothetical protein